jgi:hypothetical protein
MAPRWVSFPKGRCRAGGDAILRRQYRRPPLKNIGWGNRLLEWCEQTSANVGDRHEGNALLNERFLAPHAVLSSFRSTGQPRAAVLHGA